MCQSRVGSKAILPSIFRPSLAMQVLLCVCVCVCVARIFRPWLAMQVKSVLMAGAVMRAHLHVPLQR